MNNNLHLFRSILLIELDNLVEAIHRLIAACNEKYNKHAISHKVMLENTAFFQEEIQGINGFHDLVKDYDVSEITDEEELAKVLKGLFSDWAKSHDQPPALTPLVELKIDKVLRYVRQEQDSPVK
ncbi:MAG: hypothetical protein JW902_04870 [Syntrophaceae bacterium]|nr:hypothetical protein [Syntrophaceae bacterium]